MKRINRVVNKFPDLWSIECYDEGLYIIPPSLYKLSNLKELYLDNNLITHIPDEFKKLSNLQELTLDYNRLYICPIPIFSCFNLRRLTLNHNKIKIIPPDIGLLSNLEQLDISDNLLEIVPKEIYQLKKLEKLFFNDNLLGITTREICNLHGLKILKTNNNPWLPTNVIEKIPSLVELALRVAILYGKLSSLIPELRDKASDIWKYLFCYECHSILPVAYIIIYHHTILGNIISLTAVCCWKCSKILVN